MEYKNIKPRKLSDYSVEEVSIAFKNANSKTEIIRNLGWKFGGNAFYRLELLANIHQLRLPSWEEAHRASLVAATKKNSFSNEEWFVEGVLRNGQNSRKRMIAIGIADNCSNIKCDLKGATIWCGKPIVFEVDHIDGNRLNNNINNLRFLCPMCHKQTDTHGGKNIKRSVCPCGKIVIGLVQKLDLCVHSQDGKWIEHKCIECGKKLNNKWKALRCLQCNQDYLRKLNSERTHYKRNGEAISYPPVNEVIRKVEDLGYLQYSFELGVSDNSIRKYLQRNNVTPLPKKLTLKERAENYSIIVS